MVSQALRRESFVPLYFQIENDLRGKILSGEWDPGELIPSERELIEAYDVSRATVVKALCNLVHEGLLVRRQGKGTFVAKGKIEQDLTRLYSFSRYMQGKGLTPSTTVLQFAPVVCPKDVGQMLEIGTDEEVLKLTRIRFADQIPTILETSYLPSYLFPEMLNQDLESISLYDLIQSKYGFFVSKAREYVSATLADDFASKHLEVDKGAPLLLFERQTSAQNHVLIEYCRGVIRADIYRY